MVLYMTPIEEIKIKSRRDGLKTYKDTLGMHNRQILILEDKRGTTDRIKVSGMCSNPMCDSREGLRDFHIAVLPSGE